MRARAREATRDAAATDPGLTWLDVARDVLTGLVDAAALPTGLGALRRVPRGDSHAVLVLPGFLSTDQPTIPLRTFLAYAGYRAYSWGLGVNLGFSTEYDYDIEALVEHRLKEVFIESGDRRISLIGWSLGGAYAKALARRHPPLIRDVITLGSPLSGDVSKISVLRVYERVSGMSSSDPEFRRRMREIAEPLPGVPITAFHSKEDGVVPWRNACETPGPLVQNVEVDASHLGMGLDAFVWYLIAHRLAQSAEGPWRPLNVPALRRRFRRQRWQI